MTIAAAALVAIALPLQIHGEDKRRKIIPSHTIQVMPAIPRKLSYTIDYILHYNVYYCFLTGTNRSGKHPMIWGLSIFVKL